MTDYRKYTDYIIEQAEKLLSIDSPSGYCRQVTDYLLEELKRLGIQAERTIKGGVVASFDGKNREDGILLEAHCDTLGGMVAEVKADGRAGAKYSHWPVSVASGTKPLTSSG